MIRFAQGFARLLDPTLSSKGWGMRRRSFKAFFRNKVRKKRNGTGMFITGYRAGCIGIKALSKSAPKGVKPRLIRQRRELGKQLVARLTKIRTGHTFFLKERSQYFR